jgi:hypothetical protein
MKKIEGKAKEQEITLTPRNRTAWRRKPNAFYWLDLNWANIAPFFDEAVRGTLGHTPGVRKKGPLSNRERAALLE